MEGIPGFLVILPLHLPMTNYSAVCVPTGQLRGLSTMALQIMACLFKIKFYWHTAIPFAYLLSRAASVTMAELKWLCYNSRGEQLSTFDTGCGQQSLNYLLPGCPPMVQVKSNCKHTHSSIDPFRVLSTLQTGRWVQKRCHSGRHHGCPPVLFGDNLYMLSLVQVGLAT